MPETPDKRPVTEQEMNAAVSSFERSSLGRHLASLGVDVERIPYTPTNFRRILSIQQRLFKDNADRNHTILGKELFQKNGNQANAGFRKLKASVTNYQNWTEEKGMPARAFWNKKERDSWNESKAAWETQPAAETIAHFTGDLGKKEGTNIQLLGDHLDTVLERWDKMFNESVVTKFSDFNTWLSQMNWNRNSGHPYNMPISQERYTSVDLPNWYPWYAQLYSAQSVEWLEEFLEGHPAGFPNINDNTYVMFGRPTERIILGIEHLYKGPGAHLNKHATSALRNSRVSWNSVEQNHQEQAAALAFDDAIIMADDVRKYDRNFERELMQLIYDRVKNGNHLRAHPELRNALLAMLLLFTKDAWLNMSPTHRVRVIKGLPSGHPLTQWIGSLVHLAIYAYWTETYGLEAEYESVLSDDGIRIIRGMTMDEADKMMFEILSESIKLFGFELHPEKTVVADPTQEHTVGYRTDLEREVVQGDSTFFLKQFPNRDLGGAHGNPVGIINSLLQTERKPSDEFRDTVDPHLLGYDIGLGGKVPSQIYDLARLVDIIASAGIGNPLIDDMITYVQTTWPGFATRGIKILEERLDDSWRQGNTRYAGGTLDSGIARKLVVDELLDLERSPIWEQTAFARKVA